MVQLYIEGGLDAVLAIAARDDINPATHSPTDYSAWRFHSKVAKIGYGDEKHTYSFPVATYSFDKTTRPDANVYYAPNAGTPKTKALTFYNGGYRLEPFAYGTNIFSAADRNGFHFVVPEASAWRSLWRMVKQDPPDSEDTYIMTGRPGFLANEFGFLTPYKQGSAWSVYSVVERIGEMTLTADHMLGRSISATIAGLGTPKYSFYKLDLPVDSTPMPSNGGTHVANKDVLVIDPTRAKMAKPGYDVTAAPQNLIVDSDRLPMKVVKTGEVTVAANQTVPVALGAAYSSSILVDYVAKKAGWGHTWVPPWPDETSSEINIEYRVAGSTLYFRNVGNVATDVRFFVMAADDLGNSAGSADTFETLPGGHVIIRRPGSAGTRLRDTILDSRLSWMPIVAEAWVPFSSFVPADMGEIASHMHKVTFANPGGRFKPYVLAKFARAQRSDPSKIIYREPFAKRMEFTSSFSASTFMYRVMDTSVTFYATAGGARTEDAWNTSRGPRTRTSIYDPVGLRYYIFALPPSL